MHRKGTKCRHGVLFTVAISLFLTPDPKASADSITYLRIEKPAVSKYVQDPPSRELRIHTLRERFERAGCTGANLFEQKVPNEELPNLICVIPGTDRQTVLVGARMDYNSHGDEEKVDWATVSMLPMLAESVNGITHRHTIVFVAVGGRKRLAGWTQYLEQLSGEQKKLLLAVIDLEQVGRTPAMFNGVGRLSRLLPIAANALRQTPPHFFRYGRLTPEGALFYDANIPILMLTSPPFVLATRGVEADARMARTSLDLDAYYDTYNLLCVYLIRADELLGTPANDTPQTAPTNIAPTSTEAAMRPQDTPVALPAPAAPPQIDVRMLPTIPLNLPEATPMPVFRANARLVQVDVVVTDKSGNPITGLKKSDFTVLQDGKLQSVMAFEAHAPELATAEELRTAAPELLLPPNTCTNRQPTGNEQPWNIVLYDRVNTPVSDQQYARQQLRTVVKSLPVNSPVALVLLNNQNLEMLQDFTFDRDALLQKTERLHPTQSLLLTTQLQNERAMGDMAQVDTFRNLRSAYADGGSSPSGAY